MMKHFYLIAAILMTSVTSIYCVLTGDDFAILLGVICFIFAISLCLTGMSMSLKEMENGND